jgi:hypothetical protein
LSLPWRGADAGHLTLAAALASSSGERRIGRGCGHKPARALLALVGLTSSWPSKVAVAAATASTAWLNASALWPAGVRKPLIFLTYCSAAARISVSVTCSAYGGRRVLMLRHIIRPYAN